MSDGNLIFDLTNELYPGQELVINNVEIIFDDTGDETYLEVDVNMFSNNGNSNADTKMQGNNHIRIGGKYRC